MKPILNMLLCMLCWTSLSAQEAQFSSPRDIVHIVEESKFRYLLHVTEAYVGETKVGDPNLEWNYQVPEAEGFSIAHYPADSGFGGTWEAVSFLVEARQWEDARQLLLSAHARHPDYSFVMALIGRTYLEEGILDEAENWLNNAIEANFVDYTAHWWMAELLLKRKERDKAVEEVSIAWVLNRTHPQLAARAKAIFKAGGRKFQAADVYPNYAIAAAGKEIKLRFSEPWTMYALTRAVWEQEPKYGRRPQSSSAFNMHREKECLLNTYLANTQINEKKKIRDPGIIRLIRAIEAKQINEFIFFELWLVQEPLLIYSQPEAAIRAIAKYVETFRGRK